MPHLTRRAALKTAAAGLAVPFVHRYCSAAPSETLLHASVGAGGMAGSDIGSLTASKNVKLVAVADVDANALDALRKKFPDVKPYRDWREMFDREKFDSVNVSCPDHMHAAPTMRALKAGKHVYTQKPLTHTLHEARQLQLAAADAKVVTQMGIQIHSAAEHKTLVEWVRGGAIGTVKSAHSWSGKDWGDSKPRPDRTDPVPANLDWDKWLGVAAAVPFLGGGYFHPGNWRKRLDFGTGTFGDMGCHILDPVFGALGAPAPVAVRSTGDAPNAANWGLNGRVEFTFPGGVTLTWHNGTNRPPADVLKLIEPRKVPSQGSIIVGSKGVLFAPYGGGMPVLLPADGDAEQKLAKLPGDDHYRQFTDAARGQGRTSAPFSYAGPLTELVLLGCLSTRFPNQELKWDAAKMEVTGAPDANRFVRKQYRAGWEEPGLA